MIPALYRENLEEILDAIVGTGLAEKVFVFGSYARDELTPDSDIDLCVLTNDRTRRSLDITHDINHAIGRLVKVPVDLLVIHSDRFESRKHRINAIEREIYNDGVMLYEKRPLTPHRAQPPFASGVLFVGGA